VRGLKKALRAAGASRTYRRAYFREHAGPLRAAASSSSRIFDDLGPLDGGHIVADSMLTLEFPMAKQYELSSLHQKL
jgi:hypothetical protein